MASEQSSALGPLLDRYTLISKLHQGGMGAVYKVRHNLLDQVRVVKIMRPDLEASAEMKQRFLTEAKLATRLNHPNVAQVFDFAMDADGGGFLVMEFIEGRDLRRLLTEVGSLQPEFAVALAVQALAGLGHLHDHGLIHRDVSPDNFVLTADVKGRPLVKLIDLGIAKSLDEDSGLTKTGQFMGKLAYASPEQFGSTAGVALGATSDVYSFGVMLYELLTGFRPHEGSTAGKLIAARLFQAPRPFADSDPNGRVPDELRRAVMRALEREPRDRFLNAEDFSRALVVATPRLDEAQIPQTIVLSEGLKEASGGLTPALPLWPAVASGQSAPSDRPAPSDPTAPQPKAFSEPPAGPKALVEASPGSAAAPPVSTPAPPRRTTPPAEPVQRPAPVPARTTPPTAERVRSAWGRGRRSVAASVVFVALAAMAAVAWVVYDAVGSDEGTATPPVLASYGRFQAVVLGNSDYQALPRLVTPRTDAVAVSSVLERRYGFKVKLLLDATRYEILSALDQAERDLGADDNFLLYYAGHGYLDEATGAGYWQPIDARLDNTANWISIAELSDLLDLMPARRLLVVADTCYAGALGERGPRFADDPLLARSRVALTSGGLVPVLDTADGRHSVFSGAFLELLESAEEVFDVDRALRSVVARVGSSASESEDLQIPRLLRINGTHDEGGSFFFDPRTRGPS